MRLKQITIRGFRGFRDEQQILLDRNIVIIYGLNGSGKSSLTEALEWLFFDQISRQRLSKCKSEYQHEEYLRNLFYKETQNPFVEAHGILNKVEVVIRKELDKKGQRYFIDGKEVNSFSKLRLNLESYFRPMLAQTEIKALVDTEQKDRWEQLASILGQDDVTQLRDHIMNLINAKRKDEGFRSFENKWENILDEIRATKSLTDLITPVLDKNTLAVAEIMRQLVGSDIADLKRINEMIKINQKRLLSSELGKRVAEISVNEETSLMAKIEEIEKLFESLKDLCELATSNKYNYDYLEFLEKGRQFIDKEKCPFCGSESLTEEKVEEILHSLESSKNARSANNDIKTTSTKIEESLTNIKSSIVASFPDVNRLRLISQKLNDTSETELSAKTQELISLIEKTVDNIIHDFVESAKVKKKYIENFYYHNIEVDENDYDAVHRVTSNIAPRRQSIIDHWVILKDEIIKKMPSTTEEQDIEIRKWILLEKIATFFLNAEKNIAKGKLLNTLESVRDKLQDFEKKEITRLLKKHADEIKHYYNCLNSDESIKFAGIEVAEGKRRQAKLLAEAFGENINPVTMFSEAHTNSLALSIYFPQRVDRNVTWEVVILDDPVQSMDENHSQALIEILAGMASKKQIIVLTHSKHFYNRLRARMTSLQPLMYNFYYNDESGPRIEQDEGETHTHLIKTRENLRKGDKGSLELASQSLRKAIEAISMQFLLSKGQSYGFVKKIQERGISHLFDKCVEMDFRAEDIARLRSLLDASTSDSHAWSIADTTKGGLTTGADMIESLFKKYMMK